LFSGWRGALKSFEIWFSEDLDLRYTSIYHSFAGMKADLPKFILIAQEMVMKLMDCCTTTL
jgi:hypothetical protein